MKYIQKKDLAKIMQALAVAYNKRDRAEVGDMWRTRVMGHIQSLGPLYLKTDYLSGGLPQYVV